MPEAERMTRVLVILVTGVALLIVTMLVHRLIDDVLEKAIIWLVAFVLIWKWMIRELRSAGG